MDDAVEALVSSRQFGCGEVLMNPCPIPAGPGVYGWWFDDIPPEVPVERCRVSEGRILLYVGISPKRPPTSGRPPSSQTVRSRVKYHYRGNAEGSTLRLTLGVLLGDRLGIELRRVGSGTRRTFSSGEMLLSAWMAEHAWVSVVEDPEPWLIEDHLIRTLDLPLNLDQNRHHVFHARLSGCRADAKRRAANMPTLPR
jgi:hypothetical protein